MQCPNCGAHNPDSAAWCNQCYERFDRSRDKDPEDPGKPDSSRGPETEGQDPLLESTFPLPPLPPLPPLAGGIAETKTASWSCPVCEAINSIDDNICIACGTSMFAAFGESGLPKRELPVRDPQIAAALSVMPGLGHVYLGRAGEAIARILLAIWWFGTAIVFTAARSLRPIGLMFLLASVGLIGVSVVDAYRQAVDPEKSPLLSRKIVLYTTLALVGISMIGGFLLMIAAQR